MTDVVPISELLARLGFSDLASQTAAREVLESAVPPLTRRGKQNIHRSKVPRVKRLLGAWTRVCQSCASTSAGGQALVVARADCQACLGSDQRMALRAAASEAARVGVRRIVLVGGSPASDRQVRDGFSGAGCEVRIVSAGSPLNARRASDLERWADLIVLRCPTEISHAATAHFAGSRKVVRVVTRGLDEVARVVAASGRRELHLGS